MSNSVGDSKSSATEICINLRLNPVMPPAAVPGKYFVCCINNFTTEIRLNVEAQHSVVGHSTSSVQIPITVLYSA